MTTEERREQLDAMLADGNAALAHAAHEIDRKPDRREVAKIAVIAAIVVSLIMGAVAIGVSSLAFSSAAKLSAAQQAAERDQETNRKLAQDAYDSAQEANKALQARGQAPVPVPEPNPADPTDTIVASATARVLAQLPDVRPSAAALGQAVAAYMLANPVGPSPGQISQALAGYLATNPPPSGPPGEDGKPGQDGKNGTDGKDGAPPTSAQIQQEFVNYVQANPEFIPQQLCKNYGQNFNQAKDLTSADGTRYTLYGCITEIQPPAPTSSSALLPIPGG